MSIYSNIYNNLCKQKSQLKELWIPGSNLHRHHIIPRHSGGSDDEDNFTYLTVREHIIAHYLLWKIHKTPNDLRSMNMLGAKLTYSQRSTVGKFCHENKIGFHGASSEQRKQWALVGFNKQKDIVGSFGWWASEEGRKKRASLGGTASVNSGNNKEWLYWMSPEGHKQRAIMGAKATKEGRTIMHKPGIKSFKRVKNEEVQAMMLQGYVIGSATSLRNNKRKKKIISS